MWLCEISPCAAKELGRVRFGAHRAGEEVLKELLSYLPRVLQVAQAE